jgi:hypothetical protein
MLVEDSLCVLWFLYYYGLLILEFINNIVTVDCTDVVNNLFPRRSHLVCSTLLAVVECIYAKSAAQTFVLRYRSGVTATASSCSTVSCSATVLIASAAVSSSLSCSSSTHSRSVGAWGDVDR